MSQRFGDVALGLMFLLALGIGLLPVFFGLDGLSMCSIGSIIFGMYAFVLPSRIAYRLKPKVVKGSTAEYCIRDLFRAWGMFAVGLGAMGLSICRIENENRNDRGGYSTLYRNANCIYLVVAIVSITWDLHLITSFLNFRIFSKSLANAYKTFVGSGGRLFLMRMLRLNVCTLLVLKSSAFPSLSTNSRIKLHQFSRHSLVRNMASRKQKEVEPTVQYCDEDLIPSFMNRERTRVLTPEVCRPNDEGDCIYYWMQRDMRTEDNYALLFANHLAEEKNVALKVMYVLPPPMKSSATDEDDLPPKVCEMKMTERYGSFLLGGLKIVEQNLHEKNVNFEVLMPDDDGSVGETVSKHLVDNNAAATIVDMSPLRQFRQWMEAQTAPRLSSVNIPLFQCDAHNVVPVWYASPKREVGARTLRPKINKVLQDFMRHFPTFEGNDEMQVLTDIDWSKCEKHLDMDQDVKSVAHFQPGKEHAMNRFQDFISSKTEGLKNFDTLRNDPNFKNVCSNLSPWVNFGHVSFQRLALEVRTLKKYPNGTAAYLEEGIVRRELSDNFVFYSPDDYDDLSTAAQWAQDSLELHSSDEREFLYTFEELDNAKTHDDLWNAAQKQLINEGKMHGFLRMYWAKKVLEWTSSPRIALRTAIYFNDRYALDGCDPNGFTGVGWSIMAIHDMGWKERPIFGKIRFMNYAGCKRKFKVDQFVARYSGSTSAKGILEKSKNSAKAAALPARKVGQRKRILDHLESKEKVASEVTSEKVVKKQKTATSPVSAKKKTVKKKVKVKRKKSPTK